MRVYHFVNREYGLEDLARRRLKIATVAELNDPFELRAMAFLDAAKRLAIGQWRQKISREIGLVCFSKSWQNPVQWSHYAGRHTGLCLGFDIPDKYLLPVKYQSRLHPDLVTEAGNDSEKGESAVIKLLSTKYVHWRYEQEVRMWVSLKEAESEGGFHFQSFGDDMRLAQVIVGAESSISRLELQSALSEISGSVDVFKGRLAFRSFRVVRQRQAAAWS